MPTITKPTEKSYVLTMPKDDHQRLKTAAAISGKSIRELILSSMRAAVSRILQREAKKNIQES